MWTPTTRAQHSRPGLRYGSDLTDAEWAILSPLLPPPCPRCSASTMLPDGFLPISTVYRWFARFRDDGTWETVNHRLVMDDRERVGRAASLTAAVLDSQSVKTAEAGGPRGYDAGKRSRGTSGMPFSIHTGVGSCCMRIRLMSRAGMVRCRCCEPHADHSCSSATSSLIAPM